MACACIMRFPAYDSCPYVATDSQNALLFEPYAIMSNWTKEDVTQLRDAGAIFEPIVMHFS